MKVIYIERDPQLSRVIMRTIEDCIPGIQILHCTGFDMGLAMLEEAARPDAVITSFAAPVGHTHGGHVARRAKELSIPVRILSSGFAVSEFEDIWVDKIDTSSRDLSNPEKSRNVVRGIIVPWLSGLKLMELKVHYSVHIPYSETPTKWHPTESTGPFSTLVRGAHDTEEEAHVWAKENLGGQPYTVKRHG